MQRNYPLVLKIGMSNCDVWSWAEGEQSREQVGEWLWSNPVIKPEASKLTTAKVDFGAASEIRYQLTQSSPNGSVQVMCVAKVPTSTITIHKVKPLLPVGGRGLQELVNKLGQEALILEI